MTVIEILEEEFKEIELSVEEEMELGIALMDKYPQKAK